MRRGGMDLMGLKSGEAPRGIVSAGKFGYPGADELELVGRGIIVGMQVH